MNFLTNINLNGNELQNAIIQNLAQDPSNLREGQIWYNSTEKVFKYATATDGAITPVVVTESDFSQEDFDKYSATLTGKVETLETSLGELESAQNGIIEDVSSIQGTVSNKVDKVAGVENNIILFGADGTLKDSGKKLSDITGSSEEVDTSNLISKISNAIEGNLPTLAADGSLNDSGYSIKETLLSEGSTEIPTSNAIALYVTEQLSGITQGVVFRGTLEGETINVPYNVGDMYYVGAAGTYYGHNCEVGDVFIAKASKTESQIFSSDDWSVLESNKDVFTGASTTLVGSSGLVPAPEAGALRYLDSTGSWSAPVATRWSGTNEILNPVGGAATWSINHGLGRKDVQVVVYEVVSDYEYNQVMANVTLTGNNYCSIIFNTTATIEAGKYFAVVM